MRTMTATPQWLARQIKELTDEQRRRLRDGIQRHADAGEKTYLGYRAYEQLKEDRWPQ